jgi:hypothetical protein
MDFKKVNTVVNKIAYKKIILINFQYKQTKKIFNQFN